MYSAAVACRSIPRELDGGRAGALIRPVFSIWQLSANSGHEHGLPATLAADFATWPATGFYSYPSRLKS